MVHIMIRKLLFWVVGGSNPRKGDLLVIAGATLYAISNVSEVNYIYVDLHRKPQIIFTLLSI